VYTSIYCYTSTTKHPLDQRRQSKSSATLPGMRISPQTQPSADCSQYYPRWPAVSQVSSDPASARTPLPPIHDCRASHTTDESQLTTASACRSSGVTRSSLWDDQVDFTHTRLYTKLGYGTVIGLDLSSTELNKLKKIHCWESRGGARTPQLVTPMSLVHSVLMRCLRWSR